MEQRPPDQARFERIEAYLTGAMPAAERDAFRAELERDAMLRAEVDAQQENVWAVQLGGFEKLVRTTMQAEAPRRNMTWLRYAAAMLVVMGASVWFLSRPPLNERLYAEHHYTDPGLPVPMSVLGDPAFYDGMVSFKQEAYAAARATWAPLLLAEPANDTLLFYTALTYMEEGATPEALPLLRSVAEHARSVFSEKARWYLFLSYLRIDDRAAAVSLALEKDPLYGDRVRAILDAWKP